MFWIGIFLGYSILKLLEYGVAVIIIAIKRFHDSLPSRVADSKQERQVGPQQNDDFQVESANETYRLAEIRLEQVRMGNRFANLGEEMKVIKQEVMEMKARMDSIATITLQIKETLLDGRKHYVLP